MRIIVNGKEREVTPGPVEALAETLRARLHLTGTKVSCGRGECGSCTVMVDGTAVLSCVTPILAVAGRAVTTVEGLGTQEAPGPMQAAFIEMQAAQCGYCIPGMMMAAQALLQKNVSPSDAEIREALSFNLCRCGTHMRILAAIRRAGELMRQAGATQAERSAG